MSNTNHDFLVKNGLVVGQAITSTGTLTQAGQTFPASDGSAGQYLKTNGSGALSWGTVSTSFNITDGTTTDTVGLTETVTFTGGTNISLAVTDNTVTITNDVVDSDDITEGSSNLFYTDARAIAAIQGASNLTIDGGTLYVDTAADRVGISDTSPQQKLDVAGNIGVNGSEVIDASGNIVGSVADSAMTVGGSLAGVLSNLKVQYGTSYSGTPIQGSFFFDSLNQKLKVYTGSAFIDAVPAGSGGGGGGGATDANTTFRNYSYTLTGTTSAVSGVDDNELTAGAFIIGHKYTITSVGNTNFTAIGASGNTVGVVFTATGVGSGTGQAKSTLFYDTTSSTTRVVAYVNGIKQVYGSGRDFVATTGTSVAFTYNLGSGDTVDIQVYELLTNDAYYVKSEVYTQTEVNSQISTGVSSYLPLAGGTLTGHVNGTTFGSGISTPVAIGGTPADLNSAEVGPGYINLARDDTAAAAQIRFAKNGSIHSYLETRTNGLGFITNVGNFGFEGGNVGIGTASPSQKLHVYSTSGNTYAKLESNGNNTRSALLPSAKKSDGSALNGFIGVVGDANKMEVATTTNDPIHLYTNNNPTNNGIFLKASGDVGIGTTSPSFGAGGFGLEVKGTGRPTLRVTEETNTHAVQLSATDGAAILESRSSGMDLVLGTSGAEKFRIDDSSGYLVSQHQSQVRLVLGSVGNSNNNTSNWIRGNASYLQYNSAASGHTWEINGAEKMRIHSDGNVGIGTNSPLVNLDMGVTSPGDQVIALRQNGVSRTTLGITANYGVRVAGPSDAAATGAAFEVGQNFASDGTTYQNTRFTVQYNGNVGIGTTTPDNTLTVNGGTESIGVQISETERLTLGADGTWNYFKGKSGNGHYFNTTGGGLVVLNNAGNVGIGTSNPTAKLHVNGDLLTNDLILTNMDREEGPNEVDGTRGHWCIQEGAEDLFLINRNTGKKYKFNITEVVE
jgi:hypothetical protein